MKLIFALLIFSACSRPNDSLDNAVDEVLKHKQGVIIDIEPSKK